MTEKQSDHKGLRHLAIIMDGNGRWAKMQGKPRAFGHEAGFKAVRTTVEACAKRGIEFLTLYAFSTENWLRPKQEVDILMRILLRALRSELKTMQENNIRLLTVGNLQKLPEAIAEELLNVVHKTAHNTGMTLTLALSYGGREELTHAARSIAEKVKNGLIPLDSIDESMLNEHLYTAQIPEVDLLIRTSGEQRISNFLLWQMAYAELYFTDLHWPDFTEEHLDKALLDYKHRERRFGKTSEQLEKTTK
ncbi:MAG: isoprenyl transferase [Bacteroidetes bacterium]|nr:isoprenyl transferase [Bacteroidota bacterium]